MYLVRYQQHCNISIHIPPSKNKVTNCLCAAPAFSTVFFLYSSCICYIKTPPHPHQITASSQHLFNLEMTSLISGGVPQNVPQRDPVPGEHQQNLQGRHLQQLLRQLPDLGLPGPSRLLRPDIRLRNDLQRNRGFDICHRRSGDELKKCWILYLCWERICQIALLRMLFSTRLPPFVKKSQLQHDLSAHKVLQNRQS